MLVLHANQEQEKVFRDLIQEIDGQVVWDGRFVFMGDRLILEGLVRSLVFHFDIQKAEVSLEELPSGHTMELETGQYPGLEDLIAMAVWMIRQWEMPSEIPSERLGEIIIRKTDSGQEVTLRQVAEQILGRYQLEAVFTDEAVAFSQSGMRITYEDAVWTVISYEKEHPQTAGQKRLLKLPDICKTKTGADNGRRAEAAGREKAERDEQAAAQRIEKFHARIGVLDRLSEMQKKALVRDIRNDRFLSEPQKEELYFPIQDYECQQRMSRIDAELRDAKAANYAHICKMMQDVSKEELFEKTRQVVLERLRGLRMQYGSQEVKQIMEQSPAHVERAEYQELMEKLAPYEDIDFAEYKEPLRKMRETLEIKEISNLLTQSPKKSRRDYTKLLLRIEEQDFARENAAPYVEQILDWIAESDKARLNQLLLHVGTMDFETAASLYEMIAEESFLPHLRKGALAVISRRLEEISLGECGILVRMLKKSMDGVIADYPQHYFYPAEEILKKAPVPEEKKRIDAAAATYAEKRGMFEYPLLVVDTSKERNGRDGMLLTPEHLFYSTRLSGYRIKMPAIRSVHVSSGLLNHKSLIVEEAGGIRHKIPYAVQTDELQSWAEVLGQFIRQLQTRPVSEKLTYDALEANHANCCDRCGCVYPEGTVCPECGRKQ